MERHGESWLSSCSKVKTPQGNRSIFISAQVIGAVPSKTIRIHGGHGGDVDFSPTATKCKLSEVMTPLHILLFEHDFGSMWKARCIKDGDAGDAIIFYSASYVWKENRFANRGSGWTWHSITHRIPRYPKISQGLHVPCRLESDLLNLPLTFHDFPQLQVSLWSTFRLAWLSTLDTGLSMKSSCVEPRHCTTQHKNASWMHTKSIKIDPNRKL